MHFRTSLTAVMSLTLLTGSILAGCSSSTTGGGTSVGAGQPNNTASQKPIKIEVMRDGANAVMPKDDFVKSSLDEKLNIDLTLNLLNNDDLINKLNTSAAAGNLPDIMQITDRNLFQKFAQNGLLLDLTPYLGKLEPTKKMVGEEGFIKGKVNNKVYAIAKKPGSSVSSFWVRTDWLQKLGLQMPENPEQLLAVAKAFTENDPDGNGKKDTFGLTGIMDSMFDPFFIAYGTSGFRGTYIKDGKAIDSLYDPNIVKGIELASKFVAAGVVDPEFTSNKPLQIQDKAFKGQVGIYYQQWTNLMKDDQVKQWKTANPNAEWALMPPFTGTPGNAVRVNNVGSTSGYIMIPKRLEKEPEKLQRIFDLLNYVSEGEGALLVQFGLKDVHFKQENGAVSITDKAPEAAYTFVYQLTGRPEQEYLSAKFVNQSKWIAAQSAMPELKIYDGFLNPTEGVSMTDIDRFIKEESVKFYYGKNKLTDYNKFLETLENTFNYKKVVEDREKQLKELGYSK